MTTPGHIECPPHLVGIIDLAVVDDDPPPRRARHRLRAVWREVDDRKPTMPKHQVTILKEPRVVWPPMRHDLERIIEPGDAWEVPATEAPPTLRTGAAGAVYFAVNGQTYGPAGPNGAVVDQIALTGDALTQEFALADTEGSAEAREAVAVAEAAIADIARPSSIGDEAAAPAE